MDNYQKCKEDDKFMYYKCRNQKTKGCSSILKVDKDTFVVVSNTHNDACRRAIKRKNDLLKNNRELAHSVENFRHTDHQQISNMSIMNSNYEDMDVITNLNLNNSDSMTYSNYVLCKFGDASISEICRSVSQNTSNFGEESLGNFMKAEFACINNVIEEAVKENECEKNVSDKVNEMSEEKEHKEK